jgi:hypothetical protein
MPDLIRHPVFLFLDSGVRRNDNTAASRGECTQREFKREKLNELKKRNMNSFEIGLSSPPHPNPEGEGRARGLDRGVNA